ncbi:MAG: Asp-tRNA(Asn)/Glu-tRNA(Gln) amidotransferase subunit GatB [Oscillospiraceae bacterium]|nr:Asp-tRNA(Asn)/Glu-tRNA(Gln) amidotransferase subunit GatB [Oscillospiraceae bacterium]
MKYLPTMGLEIHAELTTKSKLFCNCKVGFGGEPNSRCCPGCSGFPGMLPALNQRAVEYIIIAGHIMNCSISRFTKWERKHYFYPDLPAAFQTSQLARPVCLNGKVVIATQNGEKTIRINRIHLEEDAGKLIHELSPYYSLADYNRCSIPLIEIVTEPDFHTADEVSAFIEEVRRMLQYAGICDGKMEQGSLRCDVNISLASPTSTKLGTRTEIKNLNSVRSATKAIEAEIERQTDILESGGRVFQQTLRFNEAHNETTPMRTKENAHDYRYFTDPDIPPLILSESELERIFADIPEMPRKRLERYIGYGISETDAEILLADKRVSDFFENATAHYDNPKAISAFIIVELLRRVNLGEANIEELPFGADQFAKLIEMGATGKISRSHMKDVLREMLSSGNTPEAISEQMGFIIKEDLDAVNTILDKILSENPDVAAQYRNGEHKVFGFLMGKANKALKGVAAPNVIKNCLEKKLS